MKTIDELIVTESDARRIYQKRIARLAAQTPSTSGQLRNRFLQCQTLTTTCHERAMELLSFADSKESCSERSLLHFIDQQIDQMEKLRTAAMMHEAVRRRDAVLYSSLRKAVERRPDSSAADVAQAVIIDLAKAGFTPTMAAELIVQQTVLNARMLQALDTQEQERRNLAKLMASSLYSVVFELIDGELNTATRRARFTRLAQKLGSWLLQGEFWDALKEAHEWVSAADKNDEIQRHAENAARVDAYLDRCDFLTTRWQEVIEEGHAIIAKSEASDV